MHGWGAFKSCFGHLANALVFARLIKKSEVLLNALQAIIQNKIRQNISACSSHAKNPLAYIFCIFMFILLAIFSFHDNKNH